MATSRRRKTMRTPGNSHARQATSLFLVIENRMLRGVMASIFHRQSEFSRVGLIRFGTDACEQAAASQCDVRLAR